MISCGEFFDAQVLAQQEGANQSDAVGEDREGPWWYRSRSEETPIRRTPRVPPQGVLGRPEKVDARNRGSQDKQIC